MLAAEVSSRDSSVKTAGRSRAGRVPAFIPSNSDPTVMKSPDTVHRCSPVCGQHAGRGMRLAASLLCGVLLSTSYFAPSALAQLSPSADASASVAGSVEGTLTGPSGKSVTGVTVSTLETGASVAVDAHGHYVLSNLTPGTYTLIASGDGFSRLKITDVVVKPNTDTSIGIEEMPVHMKDGEVQTMEEMVVSAKKDVETMEKYVVTDQKPKPFSDRNVDLPRGIDDAQPYYIFDSKTMEQSGALNVEDFLKQRLTMNTSAVTNSQQFVSGNAASGVPGNVSSINLRGLGADKTLILVDGRRMAGVASLNGGTMYGQPDINGIPLAAIDHIEVLPSSASGIYGGSALGGVINIILKKNYTGTELKSTYESTWDGHAPIWTDGVTFGTSLEGGKTNVLIDAQYSDSKPLYVRDRIGLFNNGYNTIIKNSPQYFTFGSSVIPLLGSTVNIASANGGPLTLLNGTSLNSNIATLPANYPYTTVTQLGTAFIPGQWNVTPPDINGAPNGLATPIGSKITTKSIMASIRRQMNKNIELFADFSYSSNRTTAFNNPLALIDWTIQAGAPNNPFKQDINVTYPLSLSAPFNSESLLGGITVGAKLTLPKGWMGEFDYQWSSSRFNDLYVNGGAGGDAYSLTLDGTLNPFDESTQGIQKLAAQQTALFNYQSVHTQSDLSDFTFHAVGPIVHLPWGDPTLALALEHRKESSPEQKLYNYGAYYDQSPYNLNGSSYLTQITYAQAQTIDSGYGEVDIPLVTSKNAIPLINAASIQASIRTDYESVGTGTTGENDYAPILGTPNKYTGATLLINGVKTPYHKTVNYTSTTSTVGFIYRPIKDIIVRTSYAAGFLPPTYTQLLANPTVNANGAFIGKGQDPQNPTANSYSANSISGGNPNLKPQSSKAWDVGLVWEPTGSLLNGLRFDLEYSKIDQKNAITTPGAAFILANATTFADRITRNPTTGLVTLLDLSNLNLYKRESEYWDLSIDYRRCTSIGDFELFAMGTVNEHLRVQFSTTLPDKDLVGFPGESYASGGVAKTKGNLAFSWNYQHWTLGWATEIYGTYKQVGAPGDPVQQTTKYTTPQGSTYIPTQVYHDFFASYAFGKGKTAEGASVSPAWSDRLLSNLTLQIGIKNVFNKLPAFDAYNAPYYYSYYGDVRLRDFWISVKKAF